MSTKIKVDMSICGYKSTIVAEKSNEAVKIDIESDCEHLI